VSLTLRLSWIPAFAGMTRKELGLPFFTVAEISHPLAEGFSGVLDRGAVRGQLREESGEDEGGEC
jgi:hypothetical protein